MKLTFKQHLLTSLLCSGLFGLVVACGGGVNSITNPIVQVLTATQQLAIKAVPGAGYFVKGRTSTINMALFQAAPAASATPQSFSGFCHTTPAGFTSTVLYGLGKYDNADCAANSFPTIGANEGAPVVDDGTLTNLIVTSRTAGPTANSGKVEIIVNGQVVAMGCTLGTSSRCRDKVSQIAVKDGDHVGGRVTWQAGDGFQDVQIAFSKQ